MSSDKRESGLATISDAMEYLDVSRATIDRMRRAGTLRDIVIHEGTVRLLWLQIEAVARGDMVGE